MARSIVILLSLAFLLGIVNSQSQGDCPEDEMYTQYPDEADCKGLVASWKVKFMGPGDNLLLWFLLFTIRFYICLYGKKMHAKCPSHMLYNIDKMKCDKADRVTCTEGGQTTKPPVMVSTTTSSEVTTTPRSTTTARSTTTGDVHTPGEASTSSVLQTESTLFSTTQSTETTTGASEDSTSTQTVIGEESTTELVSQDTSSTIIFDVSSTSWTIGDESTTEGNSIGTSTTDVTSNGTSTLKTTDSEELVTGPSTMFVRQLIPLVSTSGPWTEIPPVSNGDRSTLSILLLIFAGFCGTFF